VSPAAFSPRSAADRPAAYTLDPTLACPSYETARDSLHTARRTTLSRVRLCGVRGRTAMEKLANRDLKGFRVGDRPRGRHATPACFPLHDGTPYRGLRVRRWGDAGQRGAVGHHQASARGGSSLSLSLFSRSLSLATRCNAHLCTAATAPRPTGVPAPLGRTHAPPPARGSAPPPGRLRAVGRCGADGTHSAPARWGCAAW
jgi:hypothetical protein